MALQQFNASEGCERLSTIRCIRMHSDGLRTVTGLAAVATKPYKWQYSSSMPPKAVNAYKPPIAYEYLDREQVQYS